MMSTPQPSHSQRGQWSLIGTLVAVAILIILAGLYLPRLLKPSAGVSQSQKTAIQQGYGVACTEYVSQMNQAVMLYKQDHNNQPPASVQDLKRYGVTDDMINAPGCAFRMDPTTGNVTNTSSGPGAGTPGPGGVTIPNIPGAGSGL